VRSGAAAASDKTVVVSVPYSKNPDRSRTITDYSNMASICDVFNAEKQETSVE
jgi:hypothetical protein